MATARALGTRLRAGAPSRSISARRAGEATAEASSKLAEKSRSWAAGLRASLGGVAGKVTDVAGELQSKFGPVSRRPLDEVLRWERWD